MAKMKKGATAAELMARLQSDPDWVRRDQERQARHDAAVAKLQAEVKPENDALLAELAQAGYPVNSVYDLVNTRQSYPAAIPVLVKYLHRLGHPVLREGVTRALTVPQARGIVAEDILQELIAAKDPPGSETRWALAHALTVVADNTVADAIRGLIVDKRFEDIHERLNEALENLSKRKSRQGKKRDA